MTHRYAALLYVLLLFPFAVAAKNDGRSLEFIENRGQWTNPSLYKASTGRGDVYLERNGFMYVVGASDNFEKVHDYKERRISEPPALRFHAYKVFFEGGNANPQLTGSKPQANYYNYYLGNDSSHWKTGIHPYFSVDYKDIYNGVDAHMASENGQLKYEFVVAPNTDASTIKLRFEGVDKLEVKDGKLQITTSVGIVEELQPVVYQYINGERKNVACKYRVQDNVVSYQFPKGYSHTDPLVIDPTVVFASFTGSTADNWGFTATYDSSGNFYAGGIVSGTGYPVSTGAYQTTYGGGSTTSGSGFACDMAISKFNAAGTALLYSTYIGGSNNDQPHSMIVDPSGNLLIAGRTYSNNYPVTAGAYDGIFNNGADIVVTKLNATGTTLVGSTYIGGTGDDGVNVSASFTIQTGLKHNYGDDARSEIICDKQGNAYVAASTQSNNFPTLNASQTSNAGGQDGVIFKLNSSLTSLLWSTYLGGTANDAAYVLALDTAQSSLYVAGGTSSTDLTMPAGGLNASYLGGTVDGFIVKYQNGGTYTKTKGTFIGTSNYDQCYGVQVDLENSVYAMGQTLGGAFPVTSGVYSNANSSQFLIKLDSNLASNVYSTVWGSGTSTATNVSPVAFLVDTCQNVYISGWGGGPNGGGSTTTGLPTTNVPGAQTTTDGSDFYFIVFSKNALSLLYGSFLGAAQTSAQNSGEHVDGGTSRFDKSGVVYQAICGACGSSTNTFPTTTGAYVTTKPSGVNCNLVAVKIAFQLGSVDAAAQANPNARGCPPLTVNFQNSSTNATAYDWTFGDNTPNSTQAAPTHIYTTPGVYTARLVAINPNACRTRDTTLLTIIVDTSAIDAKFTARVTDSCNPYRVQITNTSTSTVVPPAATYTWNWGDNTSSTGVNPGTHNYSDTGTYTITLIMRDPNACNTPDSLTQTVRIRNLRVRAAANIPDSVCLSTGFVFANNSQNATAYTWTFGDGQSSTAGSPVHVYATPGTYTVKLVARNPGTCNRADSITKTVKIKSLPVADFTYSYPEPNMPINFTNKSTNAVSYVWAFGDATGSTDRDPSHQYRRTGTYTVCLTAKSTDGCLDTTCKQITADVQVACDVPTAFSPNGDGANDILYVYGSAIETLDFKLFNRWGELVFQTDNKAKGWDGMYKGKLQDMDSYAFVLNATFIDGSTYQKKGNVTLLR